MPKSLRKATVYSFSVLLLFLINCGGVQYKQSDRYEGEVYEELSQKRSLVTNPLSYPEKKKWETRLKSLAPLKESDPFRYNMGAAHCYRNLGEYDLAAKHYKSAAEIQKEEVLKKKAQRNTIYSLADQGMINELRGNYSEALDNYNECNRYCKIWGYGQLIPHDKIEHLKLKRRKK